MNKKQIILLMLGILFLLLGTFLIANLIKNSIIHQDFLSGLEPEKVKLHDIFEFRGYFLRSLIGGMFSLLFATSIITASIIKG